MALFVRLCEIETLAMRNDFVNSHANAEVYLLCEKWGCECRNLPVMSSKVYILHSHDYTNDANAELFAIFMRMQKNSIGDANVK